MEIGEKGSSSSSSSSSTGSRWNPTKDQIAILESLYSRGLRTPNGDQIQQIAAKLRDFGPIEGKNVFYWFQNHKARQRQKEKQDAFTYYSRLVAPPVAPPIPPPACQNVLYRPVHVPPPQIGGAGYYQLGHTSASMPRDVMTTPWTGIQMKCATHEIAERKMEEHRNYMQLHPTQHDHDDGPMFHETLQLFPLHPTGLSEEKYTSSSGGSESVEDGEEYGTCIENKPIFNFFGASARS